MPHDIRIPFGDGDMILGEALERAIHIEAVTKFEEVENEPLFPAIKSNENFQLVSPINNLERNLQTSQTYRQENE